MIMERPRLLGCAEVIITYYSQPFIIEGKQPMQKAEGGVGGWEYLYGLPFGYIYLSTPVIRFLIGASCIPFFVILVSSIVFY